MALMVSSEGNYLRKLYSSGGISGAVGLPGESMAYFPSA